MIKEHQLTFDAHCEIETTRPVVTSPKSSKRSKKDQLLDWMKTRNWTRTSDVQKWGNDNFSNRADRNARQLQTEGKIRRMTDEEKTRIFGKKNEDVWVTL